MSLADKVFTNCAQHDHFNYYCHPCLVQTVGCLYEEVKRLANGNDDNERQVVTKQREVDFIDIEGRRHVHTREFLIDPRRRVKTTDTSNCPTCNSKKDVDNGTDGASEGSDRTTR